MYLLCTGSDAFGHFRTFGKTERQVLPQQISIQNVLLEVAQLSELIHTLPVRLGIEPTGVGDLLIQRVLQHGQTAVEFLSDG